MSDTETGNVADLLKTMKSQSALLQRLAGYAASREWRDLLNAIPVKQRLEHYGRKVYSQNDEDGILQEVFRRIGISRESGVFVECGVGNGLENNTHYLLRQGYTGVWLEQLERSVEKIRRLFGEYLASGQLSVHHLFVTTENIDDHLRTLAAGRRVSVLSIDVDGNDYWLWKAIRAIEPAVVIIEYNATCPPPLAVVQRYRPDHVWKGTDYFGASLSAIAKLGAEKGYQLVSCNITGLNAFLVRKELATYERFPYEATPENLYHPCRNELTYDCFGRGYKPDVGSYVFV